MSAAPRSPDDLAPDDDLADRADLARLAQVEQALHALLDSGDAVLAAALHEPARALRQALQQLRDRDLLPGSATHRVGRTGRAGETGLAVSLASMDEMGRVGNIEHAQGRAFEWLPLAALQAAEDAPPPLPPMVTLQILGGRKEKIRAGDVLGALTGELGYTREQIGKININEFSTYVAVDRAIAKQAEAKLAAGRIKGRSVKVRLL